MNDDDLSFSFMQSDYEPSVLCIVCKSQQRIPHSTELRKEIGQIVSKRRDTLALNQYNETAKLSIVSHIEQQSTLSSTELRILKLKKDIQLSKTNIHKHNIEAKAFTDAQSQEQLKLTQLSVIKREKETNLSLKVAVLTDLQSRLREISNILFVERMKSAVTVFRMIPIVPSIPTGGKTGGVTMFATNAATAATTTQSTVNKDKRHTNQKQTLTGCSTIQSIPLPNNGQYDDVPFECTATALFHIAHLTDALSAALNIVLPHPIMPFTSTECLISPQYDRTACYSLSPVVHMNDRATHTVFTWTSPTHVQNNRLPKVIPVGCDDDNDNDNAVELMMSTVDSHGPQIYPAHFASAGSAKGVADSDKSKGTRSSKRDDNDFDPDKYLLNHAFSQALLLLQADIVSLCIRAGIPSECLWPPEAMLLNLHELYTLCVKCVKRNNMSTEVTSTSGHEQQSSASSLSLADNTQPALPLVFDASSGSDCIDSLRSRYSSAHRDRQVNKSETIVSLESPLPNATAATWDETAGVDVDEEDDYDMVDTHTAFEEDEVTSYGERQQQQLLGLEK